MECPSCGMSERACNEKLLATGENCCDECPSEEYDG